MSISPFKGDLSKFGVFHIIDHLLMCASAKEQRQMLKPQHINKLIRTDNADLRNSFMDFQSVKTVYQLSFHHKNLLTCLAYFIKNMK